MSELTEQVRAAHQCRLHVAALTVVQRRTVVGAIAEQLRAESNQIAEANALDLRAGAEAGLGPALLDRLRLDGPRIQALAKDVASVAALPDPLDRVEIDRVLPSGLKLRRVRVPLGLIAAIYESRPNVTADISALALYSGNAVVLRGGSEARHSNRALVATIHRALLAHDVPAAAVTLISDPDRERVRELLQLDAYLSLVIPRGGAALHERCRAESRVPVITGGIGICHLYVDAQVDAKRALAVISNAKLQRPTVCNALDTVLVHRARAAEFVPALIAALSPFGVSFRLEPQAMALAAPGPQVHAAEAGDFDTEWLGLTLGIAVVDDLDQALAHIRQHSSGHSDGVLSDDEALAARFLASVDSAAVYWNASTRFTDGGQFGLGAEVAVSTQRLHVRGPMGPDDLTTTKWIGVGDYLSRP